MKSTKMAGFVLCLMPLAALGAVGTRQQAQSDSMKGDSMKKDTMSQDGMSKDKGQSPSFARRQNPMGAQWPRL